MDIKNKGTKVDTKITVAQYTRTSTDKQEIRLQKQELDKFIERLKEDNPEKEYEIRYYEDFGFSGKNRERPQFKKMLEDIEKKQIDIVIITKLDRFARSLQDLLNLHSILEKNGVKFIVVEQNIDTTNYQGRLNFQILGAFAEFERNIIRERMELGRKEAEKTGTKSGKPCHRPKLKIDNDGVIYKYQKGISMNQIAKSYGVSITPIRRIILKMKGGRK